MTKTTKGSWSRVVDMDAWGANPFWDTCEFSTKHCKKHPHLKLEDGRCNACDWADALEQIEGANNAEKTFHNS